MKESRCPQATGISEITGKTATTLMINEKSQNPPLKKLGVCAGKHSHSFSLRSEAPGRLTVPVKHDGPLKPFECIPAQR